MELLALSDSYKKHGYWVRLKGSDREGRISYYDRESGLVWVVWEPDNYTMGGHKYKQKTVSASGCRPEELVYTPFEPDPWFPSIKKGLDKENQLV